MDGRCYLITGGAGFIGSNFVRYVKRAEPEARICVLDKLTYSGTLENLKEFDGVEGFRFVKGDICDPTVVAKAMAGANVIVNFAAEVSVDRAIIDPLAFLKTDIEGVYTLLQQARKLTLLEKFIQISTDEVYGQILEGSFRETAELKPRNPYAASKLGGERLAYSFFETYGLPVVITRASNNYGPYAYPEKMIPLFITNLIEGVAVPVFGEGRQVRDWLHVEDHCRAIHYLVKSGVAGEVYNVGGGAEYPNIEITRRLLKLTARDETFIRFVQDRPGHDFRYSLDCSKLGALGWRQKFDLTEGLEGTVQWYVENENWWRPLKDALDPRYSAGFWGDKNGGC